MTLKLMVTSFYSQILLHSNEQGELLIHFDHQGNHNDVIKFAGEHHLEFHQDSL
ncbi:hypothetical protein [Rickettsia honei]|uniref:hypothetical protein n=1 Tax=Rickettsia honei TaxID=37816 RepID=UPI001427B147|nr:hypothetical protein [Rickettsia honei]